MEKITLLILAILWCLSLFAYFNLPDRIPIRYDASGTVKSYGSKLSIFLLPLIGTLLIVGISILNRQHNIFKISYIADKEMVQHQYTYARRMLRLINLLIAVSFTLINLFIYLTVIGNTNSKMFLFIPPVTLALFVLPGIYYIIKTLKEPPRSKEV